METTADIFDALYEKAENYGKTSFELAKLKSLETSTTVITLLISKLSVFVMLTLFALVFSIGVAMWIGDVLGKAYFGFLIVALFYLVVGLVLHFFILGWIKKPISDLIITQALE